MLLDFVTGFLFGMLVMYAYVKRERGTGVDEKSADKKECANIKRELARTKKELEDDERDMTEASSLEEINTKRKQRKDERKAKIMSLFEAKSEITNDDVTELLDVSHGTAHNYFEELEEGGQLVQIGTTGQSVRYKKR